MSLKHLLEKRELELISAWCRRWQANYFLRQGLCDRHLKHKLISIHQYYLCVNLITRVSRGTIQRWEWLKLYRYRRCFSFLFLWRVKIFVTPFFNNLNNNDSVWKARSMISVKDEYFEPMSSPMSVKSQKRERKKRKNETVACGKSQAHRTNRRLWNVSIETAKISMKKFFFW